MKKIIVQFNEANFDIIKKYCISNNLGAFKKILDDFSFFETSSEKEYKHLEPWIQWYSFYTNLSFKEHQVFNLGDCLKNDHDSFMTTEAKKGSKVGIFSSMNCKPNQYFHTYIPDPWTEADVQGSFSDKAVFRVVKKLVNENARLEISFKDFLGVALLIGIPNTLDDLIIILKSIKAFIQKDRATLASIFDYFFGKYCLKKVASADLDLSLFFLNGLAHVQHHYMLDSKYVSGENPSWYSNSNDSLLDSLRIYDKFFKYVYDKYKKTHEIWLITGLSQEPYPDPFIYWRFRNHKKIFRGLLDIEIEIYPRMTRDFEIHFTNLNNFDLIIDVLKNAYIKINNKNYGNAFSNIDITSKTSIFSSFVYSGMSDDVVIVYKDREISLKNNIDFIALKNGGHIHKGWAITNKDININSEPVPIWELSKQVL